MNAAAGQSIMLVAGLVGVYLALLLVVLLVLKPSRTLDLQRRQPGIQARQSALTVLTDNAKGAIDSRIHSGSGGLLSQARLDAAGLKKQASDYILISSVVVLLAGVVGFLLAGLLFAILMCLVAMLGLFLTLKLLTYRRQSRFDEQVPDTLQMLTGGMRAGHSLLRAVDAAAKESESPMSEELTRIVNETRIGRDLGESMNEVAARTSNEDFTWITQAIEIHREVGGDLAEVLDHVGETIRDRNQIRRQVSALSAEGRVSALVLVALPVVMFVVLCFINPLYAQTFTSTFPGFVMIAVTVVMLTLGSLWLNRLIKPKY
ncbi:type II secretion system F family protein [Arthrobacter cupressi]|uniref:Tight adherence protein B n=1 Tax=Arthrobacter cupressi TaxID=1045773 RepID=A0A1G8MT11_9MICC|nr:type II secretion system F family protein [Arthrobacter cupressi]NYD76929.1 tight adherence protein B [Arthrobacter cupressi]SDI71179.1 tight adherence protein B [Arthrobacter cupressi]